MKSNRVGIFGVSATVATVFILFHAQRLDIFPSFKASTTFVPRMRMNGLRKTIHESSWIQKFPYLQKMVERVADGNPLAITNALHTSIKLLNQNDLIMGGKLSAVITSYNEAGNKKSYGGDFFSVILRRPGSEADGVCCEIKDLLNGTYSVSCILPWVGAAIIEAILIHPSETIFQLMKRYSSEKEEGIFQNTTVINSKNVTEFTKCSVGFPDARPFEICDYSNPTHGEKRTCLRTPSGECPKTILYQKKVAGDTIRGTWNNGMYFRKDYNFNVEISGSGIRTYIRKDDRSTASNYFTGSIYKYSLDPMTPSGWLIGGEWTSRKTKKKFNLNLATLRRCLSHKRLFFFGDSTARNIYGYFVRTLEIRDYGLDNRVAWSRGRDAVSKQLNMTLTYRSHGPPLNNPGPEDARPYMSDSFDAIREGGKGTIVMFTIGYHFTHFDSDVYLRRIKIIKQTVLSLLSRLPGVKIIIKGLHYFWSGGFGNSSWLAYKFVVILRHEFRDVKGVIFMENWDFTLIRRNELIHPVRDIFLGTIKILLPYIC